MNYTGGKFKLLPQLISIFPQTINTFVDIFGGAFNVGANISSNKVIYNEYDERIFNLVKLISECDINETQLKIKGIINTYKLGKNTKEEYIQLRNDYNKTQDSLLLFVLSAFSFNYQIRFNSKGEFNMPCGNRGYSKNMEEWFIKFNELVKTKDIRFSNKSFLNMDINELIANDFVYADPPYLQTIATYTENGAWNPEKEIQLHSFLDDLQGRNIKFALSNTSYYHGIKNDLLLEWANKYNIHNLDFNYTNNNRFNKDNTELTQEVLITNY